MDIIHFFKDSIDKKASDLHLITGNLPAMRIDGELIKFGKEKIKNSDLEKEIKKIINHEAWEKFQEERDLDFSHEFFGSRFRINLHYQESAIGIAARLIPKNIPSPEVIGINEIIYQLTHLQDGLLLVTGPTGSGKSTTLAGMINIINKERQSHIITIEDPIEYLFKEKKSIIEQREIGTDTKSFAKALKYALRQDPNVIMVGEMRDLETISAAVTAAETGHLVMSTLHTSTAAETISRIVDAFPSHQQSQILGQLSSTLRGVIAQQLIPSVSGKLVAAREIMVCNRAIANLIKGNQIEQIPTAIQTGGKDGMITMNKSIEQLLYRNIISRDVARNKIRDCGTKAMYY